MRLSLSSSERVLKTLKTIYNQRKQQSGKYSMRSFANSLNESSGSLTEFFAGKRTISLRKAVQLMQKAEVSSEIIESLILEEKLRLGVDKNSVQHKKLSLAEFSVVADWECFAVLALFETEDFIPDLAWIAKRLDITMQRLHFIINNLHSIGAIKISPQGEIAHSGQQLMTSDGVSNSAIQESHRQLLQKAELSLSRFDVAVRDFTAVTVAINPQKLPEAMKMIRNFRKKLIKTLETGKKKEVYSIGMHMYPLTKIEKVK